MSLVREVKGGKTPNVADEGPSRTRSLVVDYSPVLLKGGNAWTLPRRASTGIDAEDLIRSMLSFCAAGGAAPGDSFSVLLDGEDLEVARFKGALQKHFLGTLGTEDMKTALALGVEREWLRLGRRFGACGEVQSYQLTEAGLSQALQKGRET
jgi:hypothetical protein